MSSEAFPFNDATQKNKSALDLVAEGKSALSDPALNH
jgi:hypothetical protein